MVNRRQLNKVILKTRIHVLYFRRICTYYIIAYVHAVTLYRTVSCGVRQTHALWAGTVTTCAVLMSPKLYSKQNKRKMQK